jgi:glucuronate isomerase
MNVELVCTTDDPADTLEHHRVLKEDTTFPVRVLPAFRADRAMNIDRGAEFLQYLIKLGASAGVEISSFSRLLEALQLRHDFFHREGCRLSDHGLEHVFAEEYSSAEVEETLRRALAGTPPDTAGTLKFKSALLFELCLMDHASGWVQQFHLGAIRNINPRMYKSLGPDTGYDSIGDSAQAIDLMRLFGRLEERNALAKTIIYNLNPADNEVFASMVGSFQDGRVPGKMQFGSAWWFLDQKEGIERQLSALSNMGLLSQFVGMLTDSRSFLSYPRHDYFRRILCDLFGNEVMDGLLPRDIELVGGLVGDICYYNARRYFDFW